LTPRAVRVRNAWLRQLAGRFRLPEPDAGALAGLGEQLSLYDAFARLSKVRPASLRDRRRLSSLAVSAAVFVLLTLIPTRANEVEGEVGAPRLGPVEAEWLSVTDSIVAAVHEKLLRLGESELRFALPLSGAELAALVLGSGGRKSGTVLHSIEARADSTLHLRARLRGGGRLVMRGRLVVPRRGVGELRLSEISVDGVTVPPVNDFDAPRLRFELPLFVKSIRVTRGRGWVVPELAGALPASR